MWTSARRLLTSRWFVLAVFVIVGPLVQQWLQVDQKTPILSDGDRVYLAVTILVGVGLGHLLHRTQPQIAALLTIVLSVGLTLLGVLILLPNVEVRVGPSGAFVWLGVGAGVIQAQALANHRSKGKDTPRSE